jgi:hypothetical protein
VERPSDFLYVLQVLSLQPFDSSLRKDSFDGIKIGGRYRLSKRITVKLQDGVRKDVLVGTEGEAKAILAEENKVTMLFRVGFDSKYEHVTYNVPLIALDVSRTLF